MENTGSDANLRQRTERALPSRPRAICEAQKATAATSEVRLYFVERTLWFGKKATTQESCEVFSQRYCQALDGACEDPSQYPHWRKNSGSLAPKHNQERRKATEPNTDRTEPRTIVKAFTTLRTSRPVPCALGSSFAFGRSAWRGGISSMTNPQSRIGSQRQSVQGLHSLAAYEDQMHPGGGSA